jgi:hypothetical protein
MPEQILKFSPHRDLQCYYYQPSAIAALSGATENGFTFSGSWRQQWDWAVVEWNRDNVFEHPSLRYLPDIGASDLSGLTLSYVEQRTGCMPLESNSFPTVEWPYLRLWVPKPDGTDDVYFVRLAEYATPAQGTSYQNASVTMEMEGSVTPGLRVGLAFMGTFASADNGSGSPIEQQYWYQPAPGDTLAAVAAGIAASINSGSQDVQASATDSSITCTYRGTGPLRDKTGANANRIGVYGFVQPGSQTSWSQSSATFSGGQFPEQYLITLPFGNLQGVVNDPSLFFKTADRVSIPTQNVRKIRWTWAADLEGGSFVRTEFQVVVTAWTVTGNGRPYFVAGPGSRRIEEDDPSVVYGGPHGPADWQSQGPGNYSASGIKTTTQQGATCTISYTEPGTHRLYLGTRRIANSASVMVTMDGGTPLILNLQLPGEDLMARMLLGSVGPGHHTVVLTHNGPDSNPFFLDFLEIAYPSDTLPAFTSHPQLSLATDWDTLHSQALAPERTAWMIWKLGFHGRVNHYTGALWFYELIRPGQQYATVTATITVPAGGPAGYTEIDFGPEGSKTTIQHLNLLDDTEASIAQAFALRINQGTTAVWAAASGNVVTITSRFMGVDGNGLPVSTFSSATDNVVVTLSSGELSGGISGADVGLDPNGSLQGLTAYWRTDLSYEPGLNRACRDWSSAFFRALAGYGLDCVAAFSTELAHVDPRPAEGMAQRYADGSPVVLTTPAIQTNFSPASLNFWKRVYVTMADLQAAAGLLTPYLQSGELQWWYFPKPGVSMPFYDDYTEQQFTAANGGASMGVVLANDTPVEQFPREAQLLQDLLGSFSAGLRGALRAAHPNARYEVLYPGDVNEPVFNKAVNLAVGDWTPDNLTCLKTEGLSYPALRNLDLSLICMRINASLGFPNAQRSHLVGISDAKTAWMKEVNLAQTEGIESVVLFALDQYCTIGYSAPPFLKQRWSRRAA